MGNEMRVHPAFPSKTSLAERFHVLRKRSLNEYHTMRGKSAFDVPEGITTTNKQASGPAGRARMSACSYSVWNTASTNDVSFRLVRDTFIQLQETT
jgi:hypothetical protein